MENCEGKYILPEFFKEKLPWNLQTLCPLLSASALKDAHRVFGRAAGCFISGKLPVCLSSSLQTHKKTTHSPLTSVTLDKLLKCELGFRFLLLNGASANVRCDPVFPLFLLTGARMLVVQAVFLHTSIWGESSCHM